MLNLAYRIINQLSLRQHQPARANPLDAVVRLTVHQNIQLAIEKFVLGRRIEVNMDIQKLQEKLIEFGDPSEFWKEDFMV